MNSVHANRELFVSRFEIDGPVEITSTSNAEIEIKPTVTGRVVDQIAYENTEFGNGGFQIGDWFWEHSWDRLATFNTTRHSEFNINGDVEVLPDGTTTLGQSSITGSEWYSGDGEVIISGYDYHGPFTEKTEYEIELERLMGLAPPAGEGDGGSSGDSSGGSSGGQSNGGTLPPPVQDESFTWAVTKGFFMGLAQGGVNLVNGVQDAAVGVANTPALLANSVAGGIDYVSGNTDEHNQIRIPYIPSPDWSRDLIVHEGGTPGGWDDMHGWSKFAAGEGAVGLITGGMSKAASAVDDAGNCANWFAKFVNGGCFVAGTPVLLSAMPINSMIDEGLWSNTGEWFLNYKEERELESGQLQTERRLLIPIQDVPLGSRVPTKNPRPWEVQTESEPDSDTWAKISLKIERNDGGIVDVEMIRPKDWLKANGIKLWRLLPFNLPEMQISGRAMVTALDTCPHIACGEGAVVTSRFATRDVRVVANLELVTEYGRRETITGTTNHPVWSVDRQDWVPLGELANGETLQGVEGPVFVSSVVLSYVEKPVYNIEVQTEHVYQVGTHNVLVHNSCEIVLQNGELAIGFMTNSGKLLGKMSKATHGGHQVLADTIPNAAALSNARQAFGFTVAKSSSGIKTVFGSGQFPHYSGSIPEHLKRIILEMVE